MENITQITDPSTVVEYGGGVVANFLVETL